MDGVGGNREDDEEEDDEEEDDAKFRQMVSLEDFVIKLTDITSAL